MFKNQGLWCTPGSSAPGRLRQEDKKSESYVDNLVRHCLEIKKQLGVLFNVEVLSLIPNSTKEFKRNNSIHIVFR